MGTTTNSPPRARLRFHQLTVIAIEPASADGSAVVITCHVPDELREVYSFAPGQHITVRARVDGEEIRRSYSLCSTPEELHQRGTISIGVRAVPGGLFSSHATKTLVAGDALDLLPPVGSFGTALHPSRHKHYGAIVAGSGITPVLSLISAALATEPASRFTVLYGNRSMDSMMFSEELADLKNTYLERLHLVHVFSGEDPQLGLPTGRLDRDMLSDILAHVLNSEVDEWFLCGPEGMVEGARAFLAERGFGNSAVHAELFHTGDAPAPSRRVADPDEPGCQVTIRCDGRSSTVRAPAENVILDAALVARPDLPYSCKTGVCATCRAQVVSGQVTMERTWALSPEELAAGFVLTCQATPVGDKVTVDFDAL